jgi:uncharacterized membrane protein YraQ (UPF0718 family)
MELKSVEASEEALDALLRRSIVSPALPGDFRSRLLTRMVSEPVDVRAREALEQEWRQTQARLLAESVQLRRQTLLWLLGGAFAAGAITMAAMPWVSAHFGARWSVWVPVAVATLGLVASWVGDPRVRRLLATIG